VPNLKQDIEGLIEAAVAQVMEKVGPALRRHVASIAAAELEKNLVVRDGAARSRRAARRPAPRGEEITKWTADKRARRVPKFVIEMTGGLDTKKKIVAKFGDDATFEKGKPLPKAAKAA
jgi:hypothetical protein